MTAAIIRRIPIVAYSRDALNAAMLKIVSKSKDHPGRSSKTILWCADNIADRRGKIEKSGLQQIGLKSPTDDGNNTEIETAAKGVCKRRIRVGETVDREEVRFVVNVRDPK